MADKSPSSADKTASSGNGSESSILLLSAAALTKGSSNNQVCSTWLDGTNYLVWQLHVLPIIRGNKLEGFLNGTKPCPLQFIQEDGKTKLKPEFEDWVAIDQLLFGWLLNPMQPEVSSQMVSVSSAAGLWEATRQHAGAQTKSRILMLKADFQQTRKGNMKMVEYLAKLKNISEQLTLAGCSVTSFDLFIQVLARLDAEYNPIVV